MNAGRLNLFPFLRENLELLVLLTVFLWKPVTGASLIPQTFLIAMGVYTLFVLSRTGVRAFRRYRECLSTPMAPESPSQPRVLVDDPDVVLELAKGRGYHALLKLSPYVGKWLRISGRFEEACDSLEGGSVFVALVLGDGRPVNLRCPAQVRAQLSGVKNGQRISAMCQISISNNTLLLDNCELLRRRGLTGLDTRDVIDIQSR